MTPVLQAGLAALLALPSAALAQVPMVGVFTAEATCPATPSIREPERNPGNIATEAGRAYELIGRNAVPGSHYLIVIPEAEPERRWVAYGCGTVGEGTSVGEAGRSAGPVRQARIGKRGDKPGAYVLAASWHAAFCETRPRVAECRDGGSTEDGFALHGLWPQPRGREYCRVPADVVAADADGDWLDLPKVEISEGTRKKLASVMPGLASGLERHEWWKHGTCHEGDAEDYFADSIRLMDELNASEVRDLFQQAVGEELSGGQIRAAFDEAFGRGAGKRVRVDCVEDGSRRLIRELRIELAGTLVPENALGELILAASAVEIGCRGGTVDAAGFE